MDILTDLFRESGLRRRLLNVRHVPADRALRFPCERSVGFHVALAGRLCVHLPDAAVPLELGAGDVVVMARGTNHLLSATPNLRGLPLEEISLATTWQPEGSGETAVVSGAYQLWNAPVHPFFRELPSSFVLRAQHTPRLDPVALTVAMLTEEAASESLGRGTILNGLLDVLFTQLLRVVVAQHGAGTACWSQAVQQPHIRQAVTLLHEDVARNWTLESLASAVGLSRSVLAERFRETMGETPLAYLRTVRMQRAMRLLADGTETLEQVALTVGYQDAFGFSKAFKKSVGESPGEFRRRDAAERDLPWRLPATDAVGAG